MNTQIIIRLIAESPENLQWLSIDHDGLVESQGVDTIQGLSELSKSWQGKQLQLLLPGEQCASLLERIPAKSQRQIRAALPFTVEDNFAEDVDELHFAIGQRTAEGETPALVVNKQQMAQWLQRFDEAGITPKLVTADHQALPKPADAAVLFISDRISLLRLQDGRSFSIENPMLEIMLQQFSENKTNNKANNKEEAEENPEEITLTKLLVLGIHVDKNNEFEQQLFQSLANYWDIQFGGSIRQITNGSTSQSELLYLAQNLNNSNPINLLQDKFKRRTPASKNWLLWKSSAIAASIIVILLLSTLSLDYFSLQTRLAKLKQAHTAVYKQAFPGEKRVVRPVSQMRGKLKRLGASSESGVFFPLLSKLSAALEKAESTEITNINFRAKKGVLKIDFLAPDFASIQNLQDQLKAQNLIVTPGASNASGDKYSGRLTIKDKS